MEEDAQMTEPKTAQGAKSEQCLALRSFFQDSWIQVPDGEMPSRVMKPQALKQNISSPPKDTRDKDRETDVVEPEDCGPKREADMPQEDCDKNQDADVVERETPKTERVANTPQASAVYVSFPSSTRPRSRSNSSSLQIPYFCFSTCHSEARDKKKDPERLKDYQELLDGYKDSIIHQSLTLDEWYYHFAMDNKSAEDRSLRNREQVVTKFLKEQEPTKEQEKTREIQSRIPVAGNTDVAGHVGERREATESSSGDHWTLLRVNQIWIWTFADSVLKLPLGTC
jgi:hypothetical protein